MPLHTDHLSGEHLSVSSMQHEALLALLGHSGDIFVPRPDGSLHVSPDVTFLHPSEMQQLNIIVSSGSACAAIERFVDSAVAAATVDGLSDADAGTSSLAIQSQSAPNSSSSLYRRALAGGLDSVLQQYRCCVLHARQRLACDASLPLIELQSLMHPFCAIMARAAVIVARVVKDDLKGGPLLDYLAEECAHGDCGVRDMASSLLASCLSVFHQQMGSWMLHGVLLDPFNEFCISHVSSAPCAPSTSVAPEAVALDSDFAQADSIEEDDCMANFEVRVRMLPSFIPVAAARRGLFIGRAVRILRHSQTPDAARLTLEEEQRIKQVVNEWAAAPSFNRAQYETVMERVRVIVAERLWRLLVHFGAFKSHMHTLRGLFLLGRGDLFHAFIDESRVIMQAPPAAPALNDINAAFQRALSGAILNENSLLSRASVILDGTPPLSDWNSLNIKYKVTWPLGLLLTDNVMQRLSALFSFLFNLKRTLTLLARCWSVNCCATQHAKATAAGSGEGAVVTLLLCDLRARMGFLLENLYYYIQVDVVDGEYQTLATALDSSHDFESLQTSLDQFLKALHVQCFLSSPLVSKACADAIAVCAKMIRRLDSGVELTVDDVKETKRSFERQQLLLYRSLSSQAMVGASPHLARLLTRLDYNSQLSSMLSVANPKPQ